MKKKNMKDRMLGQALLRVTIGVLFLMAGIGKLQNPDGVAGMLSGIGFPVAMLFAWIFILIEVVGGAMVLVGYKTKYAVWPLIIVLAVALLFVTIPGRGFFDNSTFYHLISIAGLIEVWLSGPGRWALGKNE